jgi:hypothetical protein
LVSQTAARTQMARSNTSLPVSMSVLDRVVHATGRRSDRRLLPPCQTDWLVASRRLPRSGAREQPRPELPPAPRRHRCWQARWQRWKTHAARQVWSRRWRCGARGGGVKLSNGPEKLMIGYRSLKPHPCIDEFRCQIKHFPKRGHLHRIVERFPNADV